MGPYHKHCKLGQRATATICKPPSSSFLYINVGMETSKQLFKLWMIGFLDKINFEDENNRFLRVRKYDYYFILDSSIPIPRYLLDSVLNRQNGEELNIPIQNRPIINKWFLWYIIVIISNETMNYHTESSGFPILSTAIVGKF